MYGYIVSTFGYVLVLGNFRSRVGQGGHEVRVWHSRDGKGKPAWGVMSSALVGLDDYMARSEYGMGWRVLRLMMGQSAWLTVFFLFSFFFFLFSFLIERGGKRTRFEFLERSAFIFNLFYFL